MGTGNALLPLLSLRATSRRRNRTAARPSGSRHRPPAPSAAAVAAIRRVAVGRVHIHLIAEIGHRCGRDPAQGLNPLSVYPVINSLPNRDSRQWEFAFPAAGASTAHRSDVPKMLL